MSTWLRGARKKAYAFESHPSPLARAVLDRALAGYRLADRTLLKRAWRADLKAEKLLSHERRFLAVLVPKSGSRTMLAGLRKAARYDGFDLIISEASIHAFTTGYERYFRFAFVRNPWARCYSCYKQKFRRNTPLKWARTFHGRSGLHPDMSFAEFVRWLATDAGRDAWADRHWLSQHRVLGLDRGMQYDFIGTLDTFRRDVRRLGALLNIDPDVFSHRLQSSAPGEYLQHYTPELVALVARRYARDVELFAFEPPQIPD